MSKKLLTPNKPGEWTINSMFLWTGEKATNLSKSVLEVKIIQNIYNCHEKCIVTLQNNGAVDSLLPIIPGTVFAFKYTLNGIEYSSFFKITSLTYPQSEKPETAKILHLYGVSGLYYNISMNTNSVSYKNMTPDEILKKLGIPEKSLFQIDQLEASNWIIPHGRNKMEFLNTAISKIGIGSPSKKSRIVETKEGISICTFPSLTKKCLEFYGFNTSELPMIPLVYSDASSLSRLNNVDGSSSVPVGEFVSILKYYPFVGRSLSESNKHKEFSYYIDEFDPMRKNYNVYHYQQSKNTKYGVSLYLSDEEENMPNRYSVIHSSSTETENSVKYPALQTNNILNRSDFSSQNVIKLEMYNMAYLGVGMLYQVNIAADMPQNELGDVLDPILSGVKYCIECTSVFRPNERSKIYMTMGSEGGIQNLKLHDKTNLSGRQ